MSYRILFPIVVLLALVTLSQPSIAGNYLLEDFPSGQPTLTYEFQHPLFKGDSMTDMLTGFHELTYAGPVSHNLTLVGTLPLARLGVSEGFLEGTQHAIGNIYLGALLGQQKMGRNDGLSLGVYLPTAEKSKAGALLAGLYADTNRFQTFIPNTMTLHTSYLLYHKNNSGLYLRGEGGPEVYINTGPGSTDTEYSLRYGAGIGFESPKYAVGVEYIGYWLVSDDSGSGITDSIFNSASIGLELIGGVLSPSLYYSIPLDEAFENTLDGVFGIRLRVRL